MVISGGDGRGGDSSNTSSNSSGSTNRSRTPNFGPRAPESQVPERSCNGTACRGALSSPRPTASLPTSLLPDASDISLCHMLKCRVATQKISLQPSSAMIEPPSAGREKFFLRKILSPCAPSAPKYPRRLVRQMVRGRCKHTCLCGDNASFWQLYETSQAQLTKWPRPSNAATKGALKESVVYMFVVENASVFHFFEEDERLSKATLTDVWDSLL